MQAWTLVVSAMLGHSSWMFAVHVGVKKQEVHLEFGEVLQP